MPNNTKLTVKKNNLGEWVARITRNNKLVASYFGDEKKDAQATGEDMLARISPQSDKELGL